MCACAAHFKSVLAISVEQCLEDNYGHEGSNHSKSEVHMLLGSIFKSYTSGCIFIRYNMQSCMPSYLVYFPLPAFYLDQSSCSVCVGRSLFPFSTRPIVCISHSVTDSRHCVWRKWDTRRESGEGEGGGGDNPR